MRFTAMTDRGGQDFNQDCYGKICRDGIYCFAMSDGGGVGGEVGAKAVVDAILHEFESTSSATVDKAANCIWVAIEAFKKLIASDVLYTSATATAAVLITDGKTAVCSHIGDTRIYRFSKGLIEFVTQDHTDALEKYHAGEIEFSEIRSVKDVSFTRLITAESEPEPETDELGKVTDKTAFLLCTNGFWKNISEDDMQLALDETHSSKTWLSNMLHHIEKTTPADCDNLSAVAMIM